MLNDSFGRSDGERQGDRPGGMLNEMEARLVAADGKYIDVLTRPLKNSCIGS